VIKPIFYFGVFGLGVKTETYANRFLRLGVKMGNSKASEFPRDFFRFLPFLPNTAFFSFITLPLSDHLIDPQLHHQ